MGWSLQPNGQPIHFLLFCSFVVALLVRHSEASSESLMSSQILEGLGLSRLPDTHKMNVSQEEYSKKLDIYLRRTRHKDYQSSYIRRQFYASKHSGVGEGAQHSSHVLGFATNLNRLEDRIQSATLRFYVSDVTSSQSSVNISVYQVLNKSEPAPASSMLLDTGYLPKWIDFDLKPKNVGSFNVQIDCSHCSMRISEPVINFLVNTKSRRKRSTRQFRTDCYESPKIKQKCCRHRMDVVFKDLPGYDFILKPYGFDAGFCKGTCPYRYNPANHHSSLQSLIWRQKKGAAPKPCCAPSKLKKLEILHLDENDPTKLKLATWTKMKVVECACS